MRFKEFLLETPLPSDWDKDVFKENVPFETKLAYAKQRAQEIGQGSSRVVFEIQYRGRKTVLKIAKNAHGIMQNKVELQTLQDPFNKKLGLFIPIIDGDENGNWIHTEYAEPATVSDFRKEVNVSLDTFVDYFLNLQQALVGKGMLKIIIPFLDRMNTESKLYIKMEDFVDKNMKNPNLVLGDYFGLDNWGKYKNQLVIVDAGFDKNVETAYAKEAEYLATKFQKLNQKPLKEYIEKRGSQWVILNHNKTKELGKYPTKKQAVKRLRQIEYFKHLNESQEQDINAVTWYHGSSRELTALSPGKSGEDVWGSGIYLTTSYAHALDFATKRSPTGYVYTIQHTVSNPISCYDKVPSDVIKRMDESNIVHPNITENSTVLQLVKVLKEKYGVKQLTPILQHLGYDSLITPDPHDTNGLQLVVYDTENTNILSKEPVVKK